jgi:protein SCO1/2
MKLTGRIALRVFYASLAVLTAAIVGFAVFRPITVLPRSTIAPGFAFTDANGRPVTSESLRGRMVLYSFADADCIGACAAQQAAVRETYARLAAQPAEPPIAFVTVRVDGATAAAPPAPPAQPGREWHVLSGDAAALKRTAGAGFGVFYDDATLEPALILVDGWGIRRAEYRMPQPSPDVLTRDLTLLLDEARNSTGMARYAYEAAHLFLCYPT